MQKLKKEQIAIGNYHYTAWSFDAFLRSVQELGLTNIEIWGAKPHFLPDIQSPDYLRATAGKIADAGLKVICFCPEQNNYWQEPFQMSVRNKAGQVCPATFSISSSHIFPLTEAGITVPSCWPVHTAPMLTARPADWLALPAVSGSFRLSVRLSTWFSGQITVSV